MAILSYLRTHGPLNVATLAQSCGIARSTAVYHLRVLEANGLVKNVKSSGRRLFMSAGTPAPRAPFLPARTLEAFAIVRDARTISIDALSARMRLSANGAYRHVARLQRLGLIRAEKTGRRVRYEATRASA